MYTYKHGCTHASHACHACMYTYKHGCTHASHACHACMYTYKHGCTHASHAQMYVYTYLTIRSDCRVLDIVVYQHLRIYIFKNTCSHIYIPRSLLPPQDPGHCHILATSRKCRQNAWVIQQTTAKTLETCNKCVYCDCMCVIMRV